MSTLAPLKAYFDETGTHGAPVVCVAGYLFDGGAASKFEALHAERVKPLLPPSGQGIFHAATCFGHGNKVDSRTRPQSGEIFEGVVEVRKQTLRYGTTPEI